MRRNRNYMFGLLALLVSVVAVGMVYAGFTQTLNINGTGNVVASSWNIYFANLSNAVTTRSANLTTPATISNLGITLLYSQDSGYGGNSPVPDPDYLFSVAEYPGYRNGDQISINNTDVFGSKNAALTAFGTPFFTAFSVNGSNEIENYYIGVMSHGNTYYLQGGGASFVGDNYESGCNYDSVYFQSNISVLNEAFGSNNCQGDELRYSCYLPEYLYVDVDAAGNIYISDNNRHTCNTMCDSTTWCEIVQEP